MKNTNDGSLVPVIYMAKGIVVLTSRLEAVDQSMYARLKKLGRGDLMREHMACQIQEDEWMASLKNVIESRLELEMRIDRAEREAAI